MYYQASGPNIIHERINDEVVVVNLSTCTYYSLTGSAAAIWEIIMTGNTLGGVVSTLAASYAVDTATAYADTSAFITQLQSEHLIFETTIPHVESHPPVVGQETSAYATPQLETFADVNALLQLDPILEVNAMGWPRKADGTA